MLFRLGPAEDLVVHIAPNWVPAHRRLSSIQSNFNLCWRLLPSSMFKDMLFQLIILREIDIAMGAVSIMFDFIMFL